MAKKKKLNRVPVGPLTDGCIFCGGKPRTSEHVWSQEWIRGIQGGRELGTQGAYSIEHPYGAITSKSQFDSNGPGVKAKAVCSRCNNEWMNGLDQTVQPLLAPMHSSLDPHELTPTAQLVIATWVAKMVMVLDYVAPHPAKILPQAARTRMLNELMPPQEAFIYIGAARKIEPIVNDGIAQLSPPASVGKDRPRALAVFLKLKHLLFFYFSSNDPRIEFDSDQFGPAFKLIWPPTLKTIEWPPKAIWESEYDIHRGMKQPQFGPFLPPKSY